MASPVLPSGYAGEWADSVSFVTQQTVSYKYASSGPGYLCVAVGRSDADEHFVVTAYLARVIKRGKELWTK